MSERVNIDVMLNILKDEYIWLYNMIDNFDGRILSIKAWSVTLGMVGIGSAFLSTNPRPVIFLLSAAASLSFWGLEASWKTFQNSHFDRIQNIESYFRGCTQRIECLQTSHSWKEGWKERWNLRKPEKSIIRIALWPRVMFPHILVILGGIIFWMAHA